MEEEAEIGSYATMIVMVQSLMKSLVPAIVSLFLGPWSDRGGRRPRLLAGFASESNLFIDITVFYEMTYRHRFIEVCT